MMKRRVFLPLLVGALMVAGCSRAGKSAAVAAAKPLLVPATATIAAIADLPRNPLTDPGLDDSKLARDIKWGFQIFMETPKQVPQFAPGKMTCNNCHMNGGQRERAMPLVGVAAMFPEYNRRSGRVFTLEDRIVGCFLRSENATGGPAAAERGPTPATKEVIALTAYLTWLSQGFPMGQNPAWRGQNGIAQANLVPMDKLDRAKGAALFKQHCIACHGEDGQGVLIGDKKPGPLWGPDSWNDGAGAARIYTLAGMIRYSMPYVNPGVLTDEEAQHIAAYINAQPRPAYPYKDEDFRSEKMPVDGVYYPKR